MATNCFSTILAFFFHSFSFYKCTKCSKNTMKSRQLFDIRLLIKYVWSLNKHLLYARRVFLSGPFSWVSWTRGHDHSMCVSWNHWFKALHGHAWFFKTCFFFAWKIVGSISQKHIFSVKSQQQKLAPFYLRTFFCYNFTFLPRSKQLCTREKIGNRISPVFQNQLLL